MLRACVRAWARQVPGRIPNAEQGREFASEVDDLGAGSSERRL
jgi:hypothetical protein